MDESVQPPLVVHVYDWACSGETGSLGGGEETWFCTHCALVIFTPHTQNVLAACLRLVLWSLHKQLEIAGSRMCS